MDYNNTPEKNENDALLQNFLEIEQAVQSLDHPQEPAEQAIPSAELMLEQILREAKLESWQEAGQAPAETPAAAFGSADQQDYYYQGAFEAAPQQEYLYQGAFEAVPQDDFSSQGAFEAAVQADNIFETIPADDSLIQQTQYFSPAEFDYTQELPYADFAPMTEAALPKEEPKAPKAPEPEEEEPEKPSKKRRPEHKKGYGLFGLPHIVSTAVWLGIIVAIGVTLGRLVWVAASDMLAFNKPYVSAVVTITEEDSLDDIVEELEDAGLIRYPVLFKAFVGLKGGREEFSTGTFTFSNDRLYDYNAIMNNMNPTSSGREVVEDLVIPEGYTCAQIFALLEEKGVCTVAELEEYCANGELKDYWFLEGLERGDKYCLEGYLFPNTYDFYKDDSPAHVIGKMLSSFDDNYTDVMIDKLEPLNQRLAATLASRGFSQEYIDEHQITIREIMIIASMIERESTGGEERFKVSGVIYNRLTNPKEFPKLQIDATIIYALGGNLDENGNTKPLTKADLAMDHPYNSYVYDGLVPGPICNPGSASINAALDPNDEGYYFYVYDPEAGEHIFSKTLAEHEKAVAKVRE